MGKPKEEETSIPQFFNQLISQFTQGVSGLFKSDDAPDLKGPDIESSMPEASAVLVRDDTIESSMPDSKLNPIIETAIPIDYITPEASAVLVEDDTIPVGVYLSDDEIKQDSPSPSSSPSSISASKLKSKELDRPI